MTLTGRLLLTVNIKLWPTFYEAFYINMCPNNKCYTTRMSLFWTIHVLLAPEAEPVPLGRPHPVSYPVSYKGLLIGQISPCDARYMYDTYMNIAYHYC